VGGGRGEERVGEEHGEDRMDRRPALHRRTADRLCRQVDQRDRGDHVVKPEPVGRRHAGGGAEAIAHDESGEAEHDGEDAEHGRLLAGGAAERDALGDHHEKGQAEEQLEPARQNHQYAQHSPPPCFYRVRPPPTGPAASALAPLLGGARSPDHPDRHDNRNPERGPGDGIPNAVADQGRDEADHAEDADQDRQEEDLAEALGAGSWTSTGHSAAWGAGPASLMRSSSAMRDSVLTFRLASQR